MTQQQRAFTLIEILVATTLFIALMGLVTVSFSRLSSASNKALQILDLNTKADAIFGVLESDYRALLPVAAVHLDADGDNGTFTFMRQVTDQHPTFFRQGTLKSGVTPFESRYFSLHRLTDTIWVRYQWENGTLQRAYSRIEHIPLVLNSGYDFYCNTGNQMKTVNFSKRPSEGIHASAVTPMVHRHYCYFEGQGSIAAVDNNGDCTAQASQKVAVYAVADTSVAVRADKDYTGSPYPWNTPSASYPAGDYRHLYTTINVGNTQQLSDPDSESGGNNAYAVRNADGQMLNKDRLNLLGSTDEDADGHVYYPNQMRPLFDAIEYFEMELVGRDGEALGSGDETDSLGDGAQSMDISGIDDRTGAGYELRPSCIRVSFLLHAIDADVRDDADYDNDNDIEESLADAIRQVVTAEGLATRAEAMKSFKQHAAIHGFSSIQLVQSIKVGH